MKIERYHSDDLKILILKNKITNMVKMKEAACCPRAIGTVFCPGGDIMIRGIKNGFSPVGASHAESDWTQWCIVVTNQTPKPRKSLKKKQMRQGCPACLYIDMKRPTC